MLEALRSRACTGLSLIIVLCASCNGPVLHVANNSDANASHEKLSYLNSDKPTLSQPIELEDKVEEGCKFVEVEVAEVRNPQGYTTTFRVEYQTKPNERINLGSFSLYPSDNPGKFIVPTQGRLRNQGAIVLSLLIPDDFRRGDEFRVGVRRIKFLKQ
jgi:hypothetical protein